MNDELVILGSGGGRHHIRTQHRATGGFLYKFNELQAHIDPGPGAIVRMNQYGEDPVKTELFIITHPHVDHYNDASAIIESSREILHDKNYNYYKKGILITIDDVVRFISDYHLQMLEKIVTLKAGDKFKYKDVEIVGTKVVHSPINEGFGIRFNLKKYSIAYTSDTMVFDGFSEQFNGVNILILNLLRPDSVTCKRHVCTDEVIPYLNQIDPPLETLIITHFGSFMDGPRSKKNHVPSQVAKLQEKTNINRVIAAEDGLKLKIDKLIG
ncbi:MAG: MBL fold metallo-hydrolase [Promethearchaeota archaeon]|jgi:ribonuclease BN (tRNA processing enzyme)